MDDLKALFAKETPPGEPRNPYLLPFGRVIVKIPGAELKRGELDPYTGLAWIEFTHEGNTKRIGLAMCKTDGGVFAIKFPDGITPSVETKTAMEFPQAKKELEEFCLKPAEKWTQDGATPFCAGGSCGGHNGVRNIIERLGTQAFVRVKIGVGKDPSNVIGFVLGKFGPEARKIADQCVAAAAKAVESVVRDGAERAMNEWNGWTAQT